MSMQFSSIWPIDRTLSGATTQGQSGPGSNGNEEVLCIPLLLGPHPQIVLCHIQYTCWEGHNPSAEVQSVDSTQPDQTGQYIELNVKTVLFQIIHFCQKAI